VIRNIEEVNFFQVYVEPGELSDLSKLGFDYTVEFSGPRSIEITVVW